MISSSLRRKIAVLLLAMALAAPLASVAEPRPGSQPPGAAWNLLARVWSTLTAIWGDEGCTIDPNGKCTPAAPASDNGCTIDPDGKCAPAAPASDEGCTIDPDGKCAPGASQSPAPGESLDNGCTIDPSGKCLSGS